MLGVPSADYVRFIGPEDDPEAFRNQEDYNALFSLYGDYSTLETMLQKVKDLFGVCDVYLLYDAEDGRTYNLVDLDGGLLYCGAPEERVESIKGYYGMERLEGALNRVDGSDPRAILDGVKADVDAFVDGASQFDDLTMLCVTYKGPGETIKGQ